MKDDFLSSLYNDYKITYFYDRINNTINFSCHDYLKTRHFKNVPDTSYIEKISHPIFHSKNIFGEYSVSMHENAWGYLKKSDEVNYDIINVEKMPADLEVQGPINDVINDTYSFKNRQLREIDGSKITNYIEDISGFSAFFDQASNSISFQSSINDSIFDILSNLDISAGKIMLNVSFLKFSKNAIDQLLIGSANDETRSDKIRQVKEFLDCTNNCQYVDFVAFMSGLKPASEPSSIFQLYNLGLDFEHGEINLTTFTDDEFNLVRGKSNYYFHDGNNSLDETNDNESTFSFSPYEINSGLQLSGRVRRIENRYFVEYEISDGDENVTSNFANMASTTQISSSGKVGLNSGQELQLSNIINRKEVEEKTVMPILGYIPWFGRIFNGSKTVYADQHAFYYLHLEIDNDI